MPVRTPASGRDTHPPTPEPPYCGRFAPSPTGPLHLGSLIAALASFLDARSADGRWLLRMEDIDPPREEPGAARRILHSLRCHGLSWDGEVLWQSARTAAYDDALSRLAAANHLFACTCTRAATGADGSCVGNCRRQRVPPGAPAALRVAVPATCQLRFEDGIQGWQDVPLGRQLRDFVVRRKDGLYAYQLAVVVDDATQGVNRVVRGSDLLDSTGRQIFLQQLLGLPTPRYSHLPVITTRQGQKFSKQNLAPALDDTQPAANLRLALRFLRQASPPGELTTADALLAYAARHWAPAHIPAALSLPGASIGVAV